MMTNIIRVPVFGGPLDGARVSVPIDAEGWPPDPLWANRTRIPADLVLWPGDKPPEELAGPLWSKYERAPHPEHPDHDPPWRYDFVRGQDDQPDIGDFLFGD